MVGWHHWLEHEFEQALGVDDGQGSVVCCSTQGHKESDTTEQLNWFGVTAFPGGSDGEESTCNAGMWLLSLGQENPPGEGNGYPLHYSCLENSMDRGACPQATANGLQRFLHEWATNTFIWHKKSSIFREVAGCDSFDMQQLEFYLQTDIHETIWTITKDYFTLCMDFLFLPKFTLGKYFLFSEENTYRIIPMHIPNSNLVFGKTLKSLLDCKEIKPVNPKGNQPWKFIWRTEAEAPILWPPDVKSWLTGKDSDAGNDGRQKEKGVPEDKIDSITNSMDMNLSKLWEIVENRRARHTAVLGVAKS